MSKFVPPSRAVSADKEAEPVRIIGFAPSSERNVISDPIALADEIESWGIEGPHAPDYLSMFETVADGWEVIVAALRAYASRAKPAPQSGTNPLSLELAALSALKAVLELKCVWGNSNIEGHTEKCGYCLAIGEIEWRTNEAFERALDTTVPASRVSAEKEV